ncbi:putative disease resistance RPP13-like protein 1 [Ziziphus jujuba]|uniref:Disease resistance RPP13-like protein 1 n=1 Tax=Ziziphus jujuba TaxID=326968 RepID=A0ABM3IJH1_ZIZJJ|nr:putative disease resistance RPP13-like protein 1 [Ziziphus jujuba]
MDYLGWKSGAQNTILPRPQTISLVEDSGVYGRDADKEAIMELLLSNEMNGNKISVIPIVGMGGIGKTALAQLIYNEIDDKVMEKPFDFKAWFCVTNEFSIFRITKTIAKRVIASLKFENDSDLDFLQVELKKALISKKFLIVLDNVWIENYSLWSEFMKPFSHGEYGSKIIVTTQSKKIASMVHDLPPYQLTTLSSDACWNLFEKVAFNNSNLIVLVELEGIGREIVEKCKDSKVRRGDTPLRIIEEEFIGFKGDSETSRTGDEHTNMKAFLEKLQWVNGQFEHIDQRMDRLETSKGGPNLRQEFHRDRG